MDDMELIFATNNTHKVAEVQSLLDHSWKLITLKEAGIVADIPEPYDTLEENATSKSRYIYDLKHMNCFSEDTGLEVQSLQHEPGVRSARYAGAHGNDKANIQKLLNNLKGNPNRTAQFRTVISLIIDNREHRFQGICRGYIALAPRGTDGFGYDPVFIPEGSEKTFAEMSITEKNKFSHRKKAVVLLQKFLTQYHGQNKN